MMLVFCKYPPHYRAKLLGNLGDPSAVPSSRKTVKKCQNHVWNYLCLKDFTTGQLTKKSKIPIFFLNNTNFWILEVWLWKVTLLCSKQQVWLVLRFSYHILLISLCPAHQFSRKLLPMSICNLVSTKCCYHQFMEGLWQKKKLSCLQASASFSKSCNKEFCHKQTSFSAQIKHAIWKFVFSCIL